MSITNDEIERGVKILRDLGARRVLLFGSAMTSPATARDVDFACEGIQPECFFRALDTLIASLGRDVDLVDLTRNDRRARFIRAHAKVMYES